MRPIGFAAPILGFGKQPRLNWTGWRADMLGAMEHYVEHVVIETDRHRIVGSLRLPRDGYRKRITDFLNNSERDFLPIMDAVIEPLSKNGEPPLRRKFLAVARRHIVLAMLVDDEPADQTKAPDGTARERAQGRQTPP